jgi:hypothetical protein
MPVQPRATVPRSAGSSPLKIYRIASVSGTNPPFEYTAVLQQPGSGTAYVDVPGAAALSVHRPAEQRAVVDPAIDPLPVSARVFVQGAAIVGDTGDSVPQPTQLGDYYQYVAPGVAGFDALRYP